MPDGGCITIMIQNYCIDSRLAKERGMPEGDYVSLCVSDTGTGMTPDVIARAFDPFFTTKPIGQGTGLGLSMIYGFAKQSGGEAIIHSELGRGTMVCIYLPRHFGMPDVSELEPDLANALRAEGGETVVVVDDELTLLTLMVEMFEDLGYRTVQAVNGAAGLQMLQSNMRVDLLVTDVGLPGGMTGQHMATAARLTRPDLKVLFITGHAESTVLKHDDLDPGMEVLTKPFSMDLLASRIKQMIDASSP